MRRRTQLGPRVEPLEAHLRRLGQLDRLDAQAVPARDDQLLDTPPGEQHLESGQRRQTARGLRQRTEPVEQLRLERAHTVRVAHRGEPAVQVETRVAVSHVVLRQVRVDGQLDSDLLLDGDRFAAQAGELLLEQLRVRVETDGRDLAGLLGADDRTRTAQLEVAHRDGESGPQPTALGDRREPLVRLLRHRGVGREQQVGVAAFAGASDATTQLVHLPEPEQVRTFDDERVRVGDVEPGLDDGGADEHVDVTLPEAQHDLLERPLVHLPVRDPDAGVGHEPQDAVRRLVDRVDLVVHVEDLAVAQELASDGELDLALLERLHDGDDGLTVLRRRLDDGEVADP